MKQALAVNVGDLIWVAVQRHVQLMTVGHETGPPYADFVSAVRAICGPCAGQCLRLNPARVFATRAAAERAIALAVLAGYDGVTWQWLDATAGSYNGRGA